MVWRLGYSKKEIMAYGVLDDYKYEPEPNMLAAALVAAGM